MDTSKIIKGVVNSGRYTVTAPIIKEDYGLYLKIEGIELPSTYEVDFSNDEHHGISVTMIGNSDGVLIPHQFIDSGKDVFAFLYHVGDNYGRTVYKFRIPNKVRPDRTDDTPTPEQASVIDQLISALNTAVEQTGEDVESADQSAQSAKEDADRAEQAKEDASTFAQRSANSAQASANYSSSAQASATASAQSASEAETARQATASLVAEAQRYANASEQSATASANSAEQAESAKGVAQSYAQDAQTSATYASLSESTASTKASEASGYASTASQKATEASQSASQALGYKNDAESAKTASQTAQGLAESARDSTITAKDDAESARDDAESARDEAQQAVASISGALAEKAPVITDTASGSIASFSDGADDLPLKSLVVDINPVQDLSHGDPSPENICPISGWTQVDVEQSGVNVWDEEWEVGGISSADGSKYNDNNRIRSKNFIPVKPSTKYYFAMPSTLNAFKVAFYGLAKDFLSFSAYKNNVITTPSNCYWLMLSENGTDYGTTYNHDISINYTSTDHNYHPYTGRSITISLGQTVYGGKLDVLSGELVIDMAMVDLSQSGFAYNNGWHCWVSNAITDAKRVSANTIAPNAICSLAQAVKASGYTSSHAVGTICQNTSGTWMIDNGSTTELTGQLVYELAEPIEIQLSANQISSLYGVNNLWADSGDTSCEYRADTKLFIERLTAPDSEDMIADANITSGKYFMVGNSLFKATANIANGGQIIVGTNATRISLAQALNEINA